MTEKVPLWTVAVESRRIVEPAELGPEVMHYSIPSLDATGAASRESTEDIKSAKLLLRGDEILVSKLNPRKSRVVLTEPHEIPSVSSTELVGIRPFAVDRRYAAYFLQSEHIRQRLDSLVQSVTRSHQRVSPEDVMRLPVRVPAPDEQRRIVGFLDAETARLDRVVEFRRSSVDKGHERRAAAFRQQVADNGGPALTTLDPVPTPEWPIYPLSRILRQLTNGYVGPTRDLFVDESGVKYLQSLHIKDGDVDFFRRPYYVPHDWAAARPRIRLRAEDVLMVQTGAIGEVSLVGEDFEGASCHALLIARPRDEVLASRYLYQVFRSDWGKLTLLREQTGALHPHLEAGKVREIRVPVPSLPVQRRIAAGCASVDAEWKRVGAALLRQIDLMSERKQALITAAVTGQFDVTTGRADLS